MTPDTGARTPKPTKSRSLHKNRSLRTPAAPPSPTKACVSRSTGSRNRLPGALRPLAVGTIVRHEGTYYLFASAS